MMRRVILFLSAAWCVAAVGVAENPPAVPEMTDGRRILEKADAAVRACDAVAYDVEAFVGPPAQPKQILVSGKSVVAGESPSGVDKYRFEGKVKADANVKIEGEVVVTRDGRESYAIDHAVKLFQRTRNAVDLSLNVQLAASAIMPEFSHPKPFGDELKGSVDLQGNETINGVECYKINVMYERGGDTATWWIAKSDLLPRKVIKEIGQESRRQRMEITAANLQVNPAVDPKSFVLEAPEGYTTK